jgi:hypothetical protein
MGKQHKRTHPAEEANNVVPAPTHDAVPEAPSDNEADNTPNAKGTKKKDIVRYSAGMKICLLKEVR